MAVRIGLEQREAMRKAGTFGFPEVVDNTMRKACAQCQTMGMYRHVRNLRPLDERVVDLHFGKCFATGCEWVRKWYFGSEPLSADAAVEAGIEAAIDEWGDFEPPASSNKTIRSLERALYHAFEVWPLGGDGLTPVEGGIEKTFDIPLPYDHPDTGKPLRYAGRYDMLARTTHGRLVVVDEKTANRLGDSWMWQWDLDSQLTGYVWSVLHERGYVVGDHSTVPAEGVMGMVRGVSIGRTEIGHAEIPVARTPWQIDVWYDQMLEDVRRAIAAYVRGTWDQALNSNVCVAYGRPCDYSPLCLTPDPEQRIATLYKRRVWSPLGEGEGNGAKAK